MPHIETEHKTHQRITPEKREVANRQISITISSRDGGSQNVMIFGVQKDRRGTWTESLGGLTPADLRDIRDCIDAALPLLEDEDA